MRLKVKKLHQSAIIPKYATSGAACFDLHAVVDGDAILLNSYVYKDHPLTIKTGLSFEIPEGHVMLVYSRSGHGFKSNVRLSNCVGVIDSDYRGEVQVKLIQDIAAEMVNELLYINNGDRIAQAMIVPVDRVEFEEVTELSDTERGVNGFGSTGN